MEQWARAAISLSGMKVLLTGQTARRTGLARSAVASGPSPRAPCAPPSRTPATRRSSTTSSVFVSRVSLNPRPTLCFSWPERGGCFGDAVRLPSDPLALCPFPLWSGAACSRPRPQKGPPHEKRADGARLTPLATPWRQTCLVGSPGYQPKALKALFSLFLFHVSNCVVSGQR